MCRVSLDWADIGAVHVRPTFFAENLIIMGAETIAAEGRLYLPYGAEKHAPIAAADIARIPSPDQRADAAQSINS